MLCFGPISDQTVVISGGETRLDTHDLVIWRAAGLHINDDGYITSNDHSRYDEDHILSNTDRQGITMSEAMLSNALLWILSKIVNYIASFNKIFAAEEIQTQSEKLKTSEFLETTCDRLMQELQVWYSGLTDNFKPNARYAIFEQKSLALDGEPQPTYSPFPCIWFSSKMCASTIQTYHLACILLLVHRPTGLLSRFRVPDARNSVQTSVMPHVSMFLRSIRSQEAEIRYHSHEICGIAMSSPTKASIYVHQTQTLFVAGQCLSEPYEQNIVLDLLRRVNIELGWETDYRIQQLIQQWG